MSLTGRPFGSAADRSAEAMPNRCASGMPMGDPSAGEADSPGNKPTSSTSPLFWHQEEPRASRPDGVLTVRAPRPTPLEI